VHPLLILLAAAYGAAAGLLVARPVFRLSVEPEDPWRPHCPQGHLWPAGVRGWLGPSRCRDCSDRGPGGPRGRPPAVAAAAACALLAQAVGAHPELLVWLLLVPGMTAVTAVDIAVLRLPDVLTLPMAALAAIGLGAASLVPSAAGSWPRALLGGAVLCAALLVLALISPRGMGLGDVKLALALGVTLGWYGWDVLIAGVFVGFLLAMFFALFLVIARGAGRRTAFSMGPFLTLGALAGVVLAGLGG
jgi:leader peptidase (prepilin peptidase)/N-methyltransferase